MAVRAQATLRILARIGPSALTSVRQEWARFQSFCAEKGHQPVPLSPDILTQFAIVREATFAASEATLPRNRRSGKSIAPSVHAMVRVHATENEIPLAPLVEGGLSALVSVRQKNDHRRAPPIDCLRRAGSTTAIWISTSPREGGHLPLG